VQHYPFADLRAGDHVDESLIVDTRLVPYRYPTTDEFLLESESGAYFAGGILVGSTLAAARTP
jgi:hypothetical protein